MDVFKNHIHMSYKYVECAQTKAFSHSTQKIVSSLPHSCNDKQTLPIKMTISRDNPIKEI